MGWCPTVTWTEKRCDEGGMVEAEGVTRTRQVGLARPRCRVSRRRWVWTTDGGMKRRAEMEDSDGLPWWRALVGLRAQQRALLLRRADIDNRGYVSGATSVHGGERWEERD